MHVWYACNVRRVRVNRGGDRRTAASLCTQYRAFRICIADSNTLLSFLLNKTFVQYRGLVLKTSTIAIFVLKFSHRAIRKRFLPTPPTYIAAAFCPRHSTVQVATSPPLANPHPLSGLSAFCQGNPATARLAVPSSDDEPSADERTTSFDLFSCSNAYKPC